MGDRLCRHRDGLQGWLPVTSTQRFASPRSAGQLLDTASTMLCMAVDIHLRDPEFNFPAHDERGVCARYCNKQNTISIALIIFLFLWKEAASAVASANMQLFNGFILL